MNRAWSRLLLTKVSQPSTRFFSNAHMKPLNKELGTIAGFYNELIGKVENRKGPKTKKHKSSSKKKPFPPGSKPTPEASTKSTSPGTHNVQKSPVPHTSYQEVKKSENPVSQPSSTSSTHDFRKSSQPSSSHCSPHHAKNTASNNTNSDKLFNNSGFDNEMNERLRKRLHLAEEKNKLLTSTPSPMAGLPLPTVLQYEVLLAEAKECDWEATTKEKPSQEVEYFGSINSVTLVGVCGSPAAKVMQTGLCAVVPLTTTFTRSEVNGGGTLIERERHQIYLHGSTLANYAMKFVKEGFLLHIQGRLSGYLSYDEIQAQHVQRFGIHVHPEQGGAVSILRGSSDPKSEVYTSTSHEIAVSKSREAAIEKDKEEAEKKDVDVEQPKPIKAAARHNVATAAARKNLERKKKQAAAKKAHPRSNRENYGKKREKSGAKPHKRQRK
eukprot:TRINITY_DN1091_c1_g1_i1.p1 TRINITY_DN1091_c1_g1~~TRINITY_DN1091_c1_g1_i1.p1  ORF type:complete len:439 (+),score=83.07 TRINITY_DN1091_c1_g1_i1:96-1412(+)